MPVTTKNIMSFAGGVNASFPAHLIAEDQVQTATNLDFSIERGAARPRRGFGAYVGTTGFAHYGLFKSYKPRDLTNAFLYSAHISSNGAGTSGVGRAAIVNNAVGAYSEIVPGAIDNTTQFCKYRDKVYIACGINALRKDDGTNTTEWIKQVPLAPKVTVNTATGVTVGTGTTLSCLEGTLTTGGTATITGDANTGRAAVINVTTLNLGTNGAFSVGTAGIVYATLGFSDPQNVYRVSIDFSVDAVTVAGTSTTTVTNGTTTTTVTNSQITAGFQNYWHGEYLPNIGRSIISAYPSADDLTGAAQLNNGTAISQAQVGSIQGFINQNQRTPQTNIPFVANALAQLAIPITKFNFIGTWTGTGDPWQGVTAWRFIVESYVTQQVTIFTGAQLIGDTGHDLTDMNVGYTWYQTFLEIDANGNILGESAASPATGPLKCVNANATVVNTATIAGSISGITHWGLYRQGGYAQTPYLVGTYALATATITDTISDISQLLVNSTMAINVAAPSGATYFGGWSTVAEEAFYDRIYIAKNNLLWWSQIGRPDQFITTNTAVIADPGDPISRLVVGPTGLVIINWKSVYEMSGSVFEGPNADFVIQKAAPRHGSIAPLACIRTPHGIPLVNYDGITMYQPGAGVDEELPWVKEQIGDAFRGLGAFDPAAMDFSRVPAVNGKLTNASAAWFDGKLYLAAATGTNTFNDTTYVLDFNTKKCWWYQYRNVGTATQAINSLFWDFNNSTLYAGGTNNIWQLENFVTEIAGTGTSAVPWSFLTRAWSVKNDTLVENFAIEYVGGPFEVDAVYDGTATITLGTCSYSGTNAKQWQHFPMNGLITNNLVYQFTMLTGSNGTFTNGTTTSTLTSSVFGPHTAVYQLSFDSIAEPEKTHFFQTEYKDNNYPGEKLWDVMFADVAMLQANTPLNQGTGTITSTVSATGTVTAVTFVDGVAVMTNTITGTGTPSATRQIYTFSFPSETYGEIAYTTFTSTVSGTQTASTMGLFKMWDHRFEARNEPPRVTTWRTTIEFLDEAICDAFDVDMNPNGTVLGTVFVDGTALQTNTITWAAANTQHRQSYTFKLPVEVYGRTIYVLYNAGGSNYFKHYDTKFHRRPEPDRWTNYVSERRSTQEKHFDAFEVDMDPFGNTVFGTAFIDNVAISTFTYSHSIRGRVVLAFPAETYGRTVWCQYNVQAGTDTALNPKGGRFKFYEDNFIGTIEPDRLTFVQKILPPYPSEHYIKTWIAELNPLGTCTGTLMVENFAISTQTFTGTIREMYNIGLEAIATPALQTATAVEVRYSGTGNGVAGAVGFKHYRTEIESAPKPFGKTTWAFEYKKLGGASQIDMARFWTTDIEVAPGTNVTMTSVWDIDGLPGFSTNTFTLTASQRNYIDRIPFPPGGRGRLWQQRLNFSGPVRVWRATLDTEHIGAKGVARATIVGNPQESSYDAYRYGN